MTRRVKPRLTMCSRVFIFLIGVLFISYQVFAAENVYIAELMVESNVTLEAKTLLSALNNTVTVMVDGIEHTLTLMHNELVAECLIVGDKTNCNCSDGYIWSNDVCYNFSCCRETTCTANVSYIVPLCVAKFEVLMNGSATLNDKRTWESVDISKLSDGFGKLNGFESLNITNNSGNKAEFEARVYVKFSTTKLQEFVTEIETSLAAVLAVHTTGLVTIESPDTVVCYNSTPQLKCTFEEKTDRAVWSLSRQHKYFELNTGSVVKLNHSCATAAYSSCTILTLQNVTAIWKGTYVCGFISGSVMHTARTQMSVALLPDVVNLKIKPLTADCSGSPKDHEIEVTATILNSLETFEVLWHYRDKKGVPHNNTEGDNLVYTFRVTINCTKTTVAQTVKVTFKNQRNQKKTAQVDIPVIYAGNTFCSEDVINGELWPNTPAKDTVINQTCPEGRVGFKSRTCEETGQWQDVFSFCVSEELNKVADAADNFKKGLGATEDVAIDIFQGLQNSSASDSDSEDTMADISASVSILNVMAGASENVVLNQRVFPTMIHAASDMLNKSWNGVNRSLVEKMSSSYLQSVEGLVKNVEVNQTEIANSAVNSQNIELNVCPSSDCKVFGIDTHLNKSTGIIKTVAVRNLMEKLRNNFGRTDPIGLLISVTLQNNTDSVLEISLDFPQDRQNVTTPYCVFWNTTLNDWSDAGCTVNISNGNRTICECNHLTSFSVLMAKSDISTDVLDMITTVGLGVSICSLLIFLIIESLVWSAVVKTNLSHFRHAALVNIAMFLLLADCSFLASSNSETLSDSWCLVLTICKHLFYLAMFSWMLCMSVMLVHQLIFVFSPLRKRVFMFFSSIIGYVCPVLIVGSSYVYCKYTNKRYYDKKTCWLVYDRLLEGSIHAFLLPVGTVILTNLFSMVVVILTLVKSTVPDSGKTDDKDTAKSILKVVVFLTPVFGVTWIIGFALLMLDAKSPMHNVANYAFTILNSFQGLLILITGCFAEQKVREELIKLVMAKSKGKSDSMKNSTSITYTKQK